VFLQRLVGVGVSGLPPCQVRALEWAYGCWVGGFVDEKLGGGRGRRAPRPSSLGFYAYQLRRLHDLYGLDLRTATLEEIRGVLAKQYQSSLRYGDAAVSAICVFRTASTMLVNLLNVRTDSIKYHTVPIRHFIVFCSVVLSVWLYVENRRSIKAV